MSAADVKLSGRQDAVDGKKWYERRETRESAWFYFFISPWLIGFVVLLVFPLLYGLYIATTNYNGFNINNLRNVGLANFERALNDERMWESFVATARYAIIAIPTNLAISLAIAFMLTRSLKLRGVYRTLFYIPSVFPLVATVWMWQFMFETNFGLVNGVLSEIVPGTAIRWFTDRPIEMLIIMSVWTGTGGGMLIFIAGLQNIPQELEDAAKVDGANIWQLFRNVTFPLLTPIFLYQLVVGLIGSFQILARPILLMGDGDGGLTNPVPEAIEFTMIYAYQTVFVRGNFAYGSAIIWLLFIFILIVTIILMFSTRYWVHYDNAETN